MVANRYKSKNLVHRIIERSKSVDSVRVTFDDDFKLEIITQRIQEIMITHGMIYMLPDH